MTDTDGVTEYQQELIKHFLDLFSQIEDALKKRLKLRRHNRTGVGELIKDYLERNPLWSNAADQLWLLKEIRNFLTHNRNSTDGFPVAVTPRSVAALEAILEHLQRPATVGNQYRTKVDCVSAEVSLASVVAMAFEKGYSQFPVVAENRFTGLITENEITRWLGRRSQNNGAAVNLDDVTVKTVIREKDPFRKGIPIFDFVSMDTPVEEVMGRFMARPMLEVVLLTKSGNRKEKIEGIITQWDAARYPNQ
ncbi:MAG: CBS domain-containing protein [Planctomycetaceae bacterium]|nr:CBS domain-containing protein [Planctomycetaceae bacterium]